LAEVLLHRFLISSSAAGSGGVVNGARQAKAILYCEVIAQINFGSKDDPRVALRYGKPGLA
jgi:hypothetical protein